MENNQSIGGYFNLEINDLGSLYHDEAIALNTGRNALEHILNCKKYEHVYIPYFTCDVILEPLEKTATPYTFYNIDGNFLPQLSKINTNEVLLYTNYFGLMENNIHFLKEKFDNLIIDNSQAFFDMPHASIPSFYSPRKFFGVPDGGFVYHGTEISSENYPLNYSFERCEHLLKSSEMNKQFSYEAFSMNEKLLINQPIQRMSLLTKKILRGIDFEKNKKIRISNFNYVHQHLKSTNQLTSIIERAQYICPMVYPYLAEGNTKLRNHLISKNIFIPKYWQNVTSWVEDNSIENRLVEEVLNIPIDQRYNFNQLSFILSVIQQYRE
jgi:hypothetical protein